jgi:hypothetical protein
LVESIPASASKRPLSFREGSANLLVEGIEEEKMKGEGEGEAEGEEGEEREGEGEGECIYNWSLLNENSTGGKRIGH